MFGFETIIMPQPRKHLYYLFSTGTNCKNGYYTSREEATRTMFKYCADNNIKIECTEYDKHYRKYSNHNGIRFYINRV